MTAAELANLPAVIPTEGKLSCVVQHQGQIFGRRKSLARRLKMARQDILCKREAVAHGFGVAVA
jgi:hypothetical protein